MAELKQCPMRFNDKDYPYCLKEECAWYDRSTDTCAIALISSIPAVLNEKM